MVGTNIIIIYQVPLFRILSKWPLSLFREDEQTKQIQNLSQQQQQQQQQQQRNSNSNSNNDQHTNDDNDNTDVVIIIFIVGPRWVIPFILIV